MSDPVTVKPAFQSAAADAGVAGQLGPSEWNAARLFSGGVNGDVCTRDSGSATGATWTTPSTSVAWSAVTGTPTTLAGYGITDAAPLVHTHPWSAITATPTTLAGYGITDAAAATHVHAAADITSGVLGVARGGVGLSSYAVGDLLYGSGATALSALAAVGTGRVLASAGVTTAPAWSATPALTDLTLTGLLKAANGTNTAPAITFAAEPANGLYRATTNDWRAVVNGTDVLRFVSAAAVLSNTVGLAWGSTGVTSSDLFLFRDGSGALAQRNSTSPQLFRVYNTFTDSSNYERGVFSWVSNVLTIAPQAAGTGTLRAMIVGSVTTVASLPAAATANKGARAFVTDANAATFGTTAAGGGSNNVPVFSDGTAWKIG